MKVLMISGDKAMLTPGTGAYKRFLIQKSQVDELAVVVWGRGNLKIPNAKGYDVVTVQDPFWRGLVASIAARRAGVKLNVQLHTDFTAQSFVKQQLAAYVLGRAGSIRVVSEKIKQSLAPLQLKAPITVLPIFIDLAVVRAAPSLDLHAQYPQFSKIIVIASRLEEEKNVEAAIVMMTTVQESIPTAGLLIAGDGSLRPKLEALTKKLKLDASVIFLGFRSDAYSLYKGADVVINTSKFEGFGASVVEALAAGTAVVSTDVGVAKEAGAVVEGYYGFAHAVVNLLEHNTKGHLQLSLLDEAAWGAAWKHSL